MSDLKKTFLTALLRVGTNLLDFDEKHCPPQLLLDKSSSLVQHRAPRTSHFNQNAVDWLADRFSFKFQPSDQHNHIAAVISQACLHRILDELRTTRQALLSTLQSSTLPRVRNVRIWCPTGKHRVLAAPQNAEWVVQLHCPPDDTPPEVLIELVRQLIYCNLKYYQSHDIVQEWLGRLSPCKRDTLKLLQANKTLSTAFDGLLKFPGLWEGFQLGNIHKHMALHCDEELVNFLAHIQHSWELIANQDRDVAGLIDFATVRLVQSLAPALCHNDRKAICTMFDSGVLFPDVKDHMARRSIRHSLLRVQMVVPSIRSFHENMKFFSIIVKIIRRHLLPGLHRQPFRQSLHEIWKAPARPLVELREGVLQPSLEGLSFETAYWQLVLAALRNFPSLGGDPPKVD
ncbi:hypothetical protein Micbo1qcDRAFT_223684, partial [Microdochium bolleyi]